MMPYKNNARLDEAIRAAGVPIDGVSGSSAETVRVDYSATATTEQRAAGQAIVDAFDWSAETHEAWLAEKQFEAAATGPNLAAHKVAYLAIANLAAKVNAIIDHLNGQGALPEKIQVRTWEQVLAAAKAITE